MKKFALAVLVLAFGGVMLAGCGKANNTKKANDAGGNAADNAACAADNAE